MATKSENLSLTQVFELPTLPYFNQQTLATKVLRMTRFERGNKGAEMRQVSGEKVEDLSSRGVDHIQNTPKQIG